MKILVVDDEELIRNVIKEQMRSQAKNNILDIRLHNSSIY